ncbi:MAG: nucleoside 2-deoxyribosyltransferase [Bryobacteraceae bacterium]|jgi:hypothetical protein
MQIDRFSPGFVSPESCLVCNRPPADGVKMQNSGVYDGLRIECPQCGLYEAIGGRTFGEILGLSAELKRALSCATRQAFDSGQPLQIREAKAAEIASGHAKTRVDDNIDKLLHLIARRLGRPGGTASFNLNSDFTLIDCYTNAEFHHYLQFIADERLAESSFSGNVKATVALTLKGWSRVQPLSRPGGIPGQCFVAMWFTEDLRSIYESGIELAIRDAGFEPLRIDRKEHNNEITDEIMAGIRNCQFMVADFTGQRAGVYYEAGFAMGLGRPVIWCCRKDEIGNLHFDTNHKNHIDWESAKELRERLYKRIRATILEQG